MANLSEDIQSVGSDICPSMLDRSDFESWQQRIHLYCKGKDNGENILQSIYEDIQSVGSDICPSMLDRSDFESWQQHIHLYCKGKDNGENILQSIYEGLFKMGKFRETLAEGVEGAFHLGPERDRVIVDLTSEEKERGLKTSNYDQLYAYLKQHEARANENKMMSERYNQDAIDPLAFVSNVLPQQAHSKIMHSPKATTKFRILQGQDVADASLGEWTDQCDAFDSDVDEAPTVHTMFMGNLSSADPIYDEVGPSYDSNIISEVQDHDNYLDNVDEYQENNAEQVVQSNVSYVPNDALMMIINDMHDQAAQCVSANEQNKVVNESLTTELARYKEQVAIYEKRASAMQVQSALYNGHEIVKTNHALAVVHDSEDTLEIAKKSRKKRLEKMKIHLCVENQVKIAPPDYSK
nr:hypothetical protein [Tanacetum cinerariifolium]